MFEVLVSVGAAVGQQKRRTKGGSSLRVRGTGGHNPRIQSNGRFIPACAGNGTHWHNLLPCKTVHPCVCGEREYKTVFKYLSSGSSLRVRGTVFPSSFSRFV